MFGRPPPTTPAIPPFVAPRLDSPLRGVALTLVATILLSASDVLSKVLVQTLPPIEIIWLRFSSFLVIVLCAAAWRGSPRILETRRLNLQIFRGLGLLGSSVAFIFALSYLPIAESTAIAFVWPIFVMALSVPILGEKVGPRRWCAAAVGLVGVLIVLRPGSSAFHPTALLPLASALVWSLSLIITRQMSGFENPLTTLTFSALIGFIGLTLLLPLGWREPTLGEFGLGISIGALSAMGHFLVILACRFCDTSVLGPLFYAQLIWTTLLGMLLLGAFPDRWTVIGSAVILASGLYMAHRERIRAAARRLEEISKLP